MEEEETSSTTHTGIISQILEEPCDETRFWTPKRKQPGGVSNATPVISSSSAPVQTERWLWFRLPEVSVWSTQARLDSVGGPRGNRFTLKHALPVSDRCGGARVCDPGVHLNKEKRKKRERRGKGEMEAAGKGDRFLLIGSPAQILAICLLVSLCQWAGLKKAGASQLIRRPWQGSRRRRWRCST